jgi:hypothetical protein
LQKKFQPTFAAEDLAKLPNYQAIATVMIHNVPSAPFSMALLPPMGEDNEKLLMALKTYSASKYGRPRAIVDTEINRRLMSSEQVRATAPASQVPAASAVATNVPQQQPQAPVQAQAVATSMPVPSVGMTTAGVPNHKKAPQNNTRRFLDDWQAKKQGLQSNVVKNTTNDVKNNDGVVKNTTVVENRGGAENSATVSQPAPKTAQPHEDGSGFSLKLR